MPIRNYPFTDPGDGKPRPMLWVRVINPHTQQIHPPILALVDTGADECAFPAAAAFLLGHELEVVARKKVITAGGTTFAYPHMSKVEILEKQPDGRPGDKVLHIISDTPIDFMIGLKSFVLGTKHFLSLFSLKIDYQRQVFSIYRPQPQKKKKKRR